MYFIEFDIFGEINSNPPSSSRDKEKKINEKSEEKNEEKPTDTDKTSGKSKYKYEMPDGW